MLHINGVNRCIDTAILYYPLYPYDYIEFTSLDAFIKSQNLKILGEKKWYQASTKDYSINDMRILLLTSVADHDSLKLYNFFGVNNDTVKIVKKEMLLYNPFLSSIDTINYVEKEHFITSKKMKKLLCYLNKIEHYDTFYNYGYPSSLTMEFVINHRYRLLLFVAPDDYGWGDRYSKRIASKIVKWLNKL